MVILFISAGEIWAGIILFALLGMYAVANFMMSHFNELSEKVRKLTDKELVSRFRILSESYETKATYWKAQELREILEERQNRGLLAKMADEELSLYFKTLSEAYKALPSYWRKQELAYVKKEMDNRHLL